MIIVRNEVIEIRGDVAKHFLANFSYEHQRKIRKEHVAYLADQMIKKRFDPTGQIAFAILEDKKYLVNGYHTLHAIIASGTSQSLNLLHYKVENYNEVGTLYGHYDMGVARNTSDYLRAIGIGDKLDLKKWQENRLAGALRYLKGGFPVSKFMGKFKGKISGEDMVKYMEVWQKEARLLFELHSECDFPSGDLMRLRVLVAPVFAVHLVLAKYCAEDVIDFFPLVCTDDGLRVGDPRKTLHKYLRSTARSNNAQKSISNGHISRAVAKSWNSWIKGDTLKRINIKTHQVQSNIILENTPFDGLLWRPKSMED